MNGKRKEARGAAAREGEALDNESVARVGAVSRMLLPTDGLWRGAMNAFQDPTLLAQLGPQPARPLGAAIDRHGTAGT